MNKSHCWKCVVNKDLCYVDHIMMKNTMEMINQEKLSKLIQSYKSEFNKYIDQELYKWRAVAHFQKYWECSFKL